MTIKAKQKELILSTLKTISESNTFSGSDRNIKILHFLVDCYLKEIHVKEAVLELELFKEKQSISYDGKVRVYMFNLRKKLEEYYRTEGSSDKIVFNIKKGQYNLSVEEVQKSKQKISKKLVLLPVPILCLTLVCLFLNKVTLAPEYCWKSFFENQTTCCVGDHFIIVSKLNGKRISSYLEAINSDKNFEDFLKEQNKNNETFTKAPFSFVTKMGPVCTARLAGWFAKNDRDFTVAMESEMSFDNLSKNNIIYIGPFRTMDLFSSLFLKDSKMFSYNGRSIVERKTGKQIRDIKINNARQDHVMVSYNRLTDTGQDILFFAANNDIGVLAAVKNFTNQKWLDDFYKNLPDENAYFNALFAVKGIGRTDLECELKQVEVLKK